MKIALQLSGYMRTYSYCFGSLKTKILDVLRPDIFGCTYDKIGFNHHDGMLRDRDSKNAIADFKMMAAPKKLVVQKFEWIKQDEFMKRKPQMEWCRNRDPQLATIIHRTPHASSLQSVLGMYKNIWQTNQLRKDYEAKNGIKYDVVIRSRFDLLYDAKIDYREILACVENGSLYVPAHTNCVGHNGVHDMFAFAKADIMDIYCDTFNHIHDYVMKDNLLIHPESLLGHHLRKNNIVVAKTKMKHVIKRGTGQISDMRAWD